MDVAMAMQNPLHSYSLARGLVEDNKRQDWEGTSSWPELRSQPASMRILRYEPFQREHDAQHELLGRFRTRSLGIIFPDALEVVGCLGRISQVHFPDFALVLIRA
jgi:hypothetical protein